MLRTLEIRDLLIIDRLDLTFHPGLNVLTGETGAGKSILLDSLGFVLGWRGRADLVRQGAERGEVTAAFEVPADHPAQAVLADAGLPGGEDLLLRRINTADGRKTAWVNDRRASAETLRALADTLLEVHGQQDDGGLLDPRGHRALLDAFGRHEDLRRRTRAGWTALSRARAALETAVAALEQARADEDFLRHAVAELDGIDPKPGEDAELDTRRRAMQAAERVREDVARALAALGNDGAEGAAGDALRWLEGAADAVGDGLLEGPVAALARALDELAEAQSGTESALERLSFDPQDLEQAEERLFEIRALARKHGVVADDLPMLADDLRARLRALDAGEADLAAHEAAVRDAQAEFEDAGRDLTRERRRAAGVLDAAIMAELAPLKLERAVFMTEITAAPPGPEGADQVIFTVATNPGAPAGPLNRIASGGELSRFLLAMKVCLAGQMPGKTLIFDEIDRGVGGATADAVGRRLASLAEGGQVLVVTHSPQVAARGAHHWQVSKAVSKGVTLSSVVELTGEDRVEELARMLAGDTLTPQARAAARALLDG